ncbi:hypothetical protein HDU88_000235 [Geranomyces variabilis]|nr:hypothetical protein HDU88_000235 [Geranomyces variabilis]
MFTVPRNMGARRRPFTIHILGALFFAVLLWFAYGRVFRERVQTVAAIVEGRQLNNLVPLILHFVGFLGPNWPVHVFHSARNSQNFTTSATIMKYVKSSRIVLHELPAEMIDFASPVDVSRFLTTDELWKRLLPATHVLMFQADSMVCGASASKPEDFLKYSFVGAPITYEYGHGFNGGLSLRHIPSLLRTVREWEYTDNDAEDQFFSNVIPMLRPPAPEVPQEDVAGQFSVETVWYDRPMGFHQARRWNGDRMPYIMTYCPEVALAEAGHSFLHP